jgi:hypothetical protein
VKEFYRNLLQSDGKTVSLGHFALERSIEGIIVFRFSRQLEPIIGLNRCLPVAIQERII